MEELETQRPVSTGNIAIHPDSPDLRLRRRTMAFAWITYLGLLNLTLAAIGTTVLLQGNQTITPKSSAAPLGWFLTSMAFLAVVFPAALFFRQWICRKYDRGEVVAPRHYAIGMTCTWLALEASMLLSLFACHITSTFTPAITVGVAFVFYLTIWPSGSMLFSHNGSSDDPSLYRTPR